MRSEHSIHVFINKQKYELSTATQTGASLKSLAAIPLLDALFLQQRGDDLVVANDATVTLKNGAQLHSQPPADYGNLVVTVEDILAESGIDPENATLHPASDGWTFLVLSEYQLPEGYTPNQVRLLVKLSPTYPDAAPDMFWVSPTVRVSDGSLPRATSPERLLGEDWQRFSWHLAAGAWRPGVSSLRDFLRCIAARFLHRD